MNQNNEPFDTIMDILKRDIELSRLLETKAAILFLDQNKEDEALIAIDKSLELYPDRTSAWEFKALILYKIGKKDLALDAINQSITLNSKRPSAWELKVTILDDLGQKEEANKVRDHLGEVTTKANLQILINRHGINIIHDKKKLYSLLNDLNNGKFQREIKLIAISLDEKIPFLLLEQKNNINIRVLRLQLIKKLETDIGILPTLSKWIVDSWIEVLHTTIKNGDYTDLFDAPHIENNNDENNHDIDRQNPVDNEIIEFAPVINNTDIEKLDQNSLNDLIIDLKNLQLEIMALPDNTEPEIERKKQLIDEFHKEFGPILYATFSNSSKNDFLQLNQSNIKKTKTNEYKSNSNKGNFESTIDHKTTTNYNDYQNKIESSKDTKIIISTLLFIVPLIIAILILPTDLPIFGSNIPYYGFLLAFSIFLIVGSFAPDLEHGIALFIMGLIFFSPMFMILLFISIGEFGNAIWMPLKVIIGVLIGIAFLIIYLKNF